MNDDDDVGYLNDAQWCRNSLRNYFFIFNHLAWCGDAGGVNPWRNGNREKAHEVAQDGSMTLIVLSDFPGQNCTTG